MNEPKTPNLGLNKIDRSSPSTTYFDLDKYLDQNWEKVDESVATKEDLEELREAVSEVDVPDASLTQKGKVQLSNEVDSNAEDMAATPKAVKAVLIEALSAKQLGVEQKANVVAALNSIGVSASTSESWDSLITKMSGVVWATGNATAAQVLVGATFSKEEANGLIGTMPNRSAENVNMPGQEETARPGDRLFIRPPHGFYNGATWVTAPAPNLKSENIPKDTQILGIQGILERLTTSEKQTIASQITAKGIQATTNDSNTVLAQKIGMIETRKYARGSLNASEGQVYVSGVAFRPKMVKLYGRYSNSDNRFTACFLFDEPIDRVYGFITPDTTTDGSGMSGFGSALRDNLISNNGFSVKNYNWQYNQIYWEAWGN